MEKSTEPRAFLYLKYVIPFLIVLLVGLFLLFRFRPEKENEAQQIERDAASRIEALKAESKEPIDLETADHFVGAQAALSRKDRQIITTTPKALLEDQSFGAESEIKVLVEKEETVITTPRELLKNRTIHPDTPIRILKEGGLVKETTVRKLLADRSIPLDTPIKIIQKQQKVIITTPAELQRIVPSPETPVKIVVEKPGEILTLGQILPGDQGLEGDTFYIHSVTRKDVQGIWGIIQHGLMDQFLKGVPVTVSEDFPEKQVLALEIPEYADEPREDGYSSYLGKVLAKKTAESYVYNYANGRMGKDPDYVFPGQELVITRFSKKELVRIYKHFSQNL